MVHCKPQTNIHHHNIILHLLLWELSTNLRGDLYPLIPQTMLVMVSRCSASRGNVFWSLGKGNKGIVCALQQEQLRFTHLTPTLFYCDHGMWFFCSKWVNGWMDCVASKRVVWRLDRRGKQGLVGMVCTDKLSQIIYHSTDTNTSTGPLHL